MLEISIATIICSKSQFILSTSKYSSSYVANNQHLLTLEHAVFFTHLVYIPSLYTNVLSSEHELLNSIKSLPLLMPKKSFPL